MRTESAVSAVMQLFRLYSSCFGCVVLRFELDVRLGCFGQVLLRTSSLTVTCSRGKQDWVGWGATGKFSFLFKRNFHGHLMLKV